MVLSGRASSAASTAELAACPLSELAILSGMSRAFIWRGLYCRFDRSTILRGRFRRRNFAPAQKRHRNPIYPRCVSIRLHLCSDRSNNR